MTERVLLVDDEPLVLEGLKRQLRKTVDVETAAVCDPIATSTPLAYSLIVVRSYVAAR